MLGSVHDAEDVVQEALLRAWRALDGFERRSSVNTWLYRIATNACLDELERRPRRPEPLRSPTRTTGSRTAAAPVADPAARYAAREGMELAFLTAIQRLPGRQRAVLILRDVLGWSAAEAADLLDTTVAGGQQRAPARAGDDRPRRSARAGGAARAGERVLLRRYVDAWEHADIDGARRAAARGRGAHACRPARRSPARRRSARFFGDCRAARGIGTMRVGGRRAPTAACGSRCK